MEHASAHRETVAQRERVAGEAEPHHVAHLVDVVRRHDQDAARGLREEHAVRRGPLVVGQRVHGELLEQPVGRRMPLHA